MSDQAENTATQQVVECFRKANEAKAKLEGAMKMLGDRLGALAPTLQTPARYIFCVDNSDNITVGQHDGELHRRPVARVTPSDINWKDLCEMVRGYNQAREDRTRSAAQLKAMGLPISE